WKTSSLMSSASLTPETSAPRCAVSGRTEMGKRRSAVELMVWRASLATPLQVSSRRTDITRAAGTLEATDRFGEELFGQPQHHLRKHDGKGDGQEEHDVERQRANHRLAEAYTDVFRSHQQRQAVRRRDQAEHQRGNDHNAHVQGVDVADLGQLADDRHENDDRWVGVDEM